MAEDGDSEYLTEPQDEVEADERAPDPEERLVNVVTALVADSQAAVRAELGQGALDHPAMTPEPFLGFDALASDPATDSASPQITPAATVVVALVGMELGRALAGTAPRALDRGNRLDQFLEDDLVGDVGRGELERKGNTLLVDQNVALRARFAAICWIRAGSGSPLLAGMLAASKDARAQSIWSASPKVSKSVCCKRSQTPAFIQSRRRRQQVIPDPQPISWGNISQGIPLLRTNRMPVRAARSGTRGRPPFGLGGSSGRSGWTAAQSWSVTSGLLIPHCTR